MSLIAAQKVIQSSPAVHTADMWPGDGNILKFLFVSICKVWSCFENLKGLVQKKLHLTHVEFCRFLWTLHSARVHTSSHFEQLLHHSIGCCFAATPIQEKPKLIEFNSIYVTIGIVSLPIITQLFEMEVPSNLSTSDVISVSRKRISLNLNAVYCTVSLFLLHSHSSTLKISCRVQNLLQH